MALNGELRTVTKSMFYGTELCKEVYSGFGFFVSAQTSQLTHITLGNCPVMLLLPAVSK